MRYMRYMRYTCAMRYTTVTPRSGRRKARVRGPPKTSASVYSQKHASGALRRLLALVARAP